MDAQDFNFAFKFLHVAYIWTEIWYFWIKIVQQGNFWTE